MIPAGAPAEPAAPDWPLNLPTRYLTSNFMEYRGGRFHAGLDLKTQSRNGFTVRAVENGWIQRVRATPTAYGRAIYLHGDSGRTYVFAHLMRFNDVLRQRVDQQRATTGRYRARLEFGPNELRVRRGEVLGLSGESGTGGPHLHFEVRDDQQRPHNPLDMGFAVPDTLAPVVHGIRVLPVDPTTRIQGAEAAALLSATGPGGLAGMMPALHVSGPVAFSAKIVDAADIRGHRLEPWLIEVRLNGEPVYRCRNESFSFGDNSQQRLEWLELPATTGRDAVREHWLHRHPAVSLPGREGQLWYLGDAGNGLAPGRHRLDVVASDRAGNKTAVAFPLVVSIGDSDSTAASLCRLAWQQAPTGLLPIAGSEDAGALNTEGCLLTPFFLREWPVRNGPGLRRQLLDPTAGDPVLAATWLLSRADTLTAEQIAQAHKQGLEPVGGVTEYLAADWPIDAAVTTELLGGLARADSMLANDLAVYRWDRNEWKPADDLVQPAQGSEAYRCAVSDPGLHAVMRDDTAPQVTVTKSLIEVARGAETQVSGVTLPRWEVFPVPLWETGSGIAPESVMVTLDGAALIVEPDLPRDRLLVELPDQTPPGSHVLSVQVSDEAGNTVQTELEVLCR